MAPSKRPLQTILDLRSKVATSYSSRCYQRETRQLVLPKVKTTPAHSQQRIVTRLELRPRKARPITKLPGRWNNPTKDETILLNIPESPLLTKNNNNTTEWHPES